MLSRIILFILLIGVTSIATSAQSASPRHPRTVVDYYMLLPDKYFEANREQRLHWMLDLKRGAIVDIPNGYLFAPGDGAQTDIYACIFKRSNGDHLVAVGYNDKNGVFETFLDFFIYARGRLRNVTKTVLPVRFSKLLYYDLPRHGTTIRVTNASGKKLYDLVWTGKVFHLKRAIGSCRIMDRVNAAATDG
jgi:hypothetical protein